MSLAEHTEVLHDDVPAGLQRLYQLAGGAWTGTQDVEQPVTSRDRASSVPV
ncbi:hypothetical protein [Lentzea sp. E54]|uniref:hypothetical protein n=1 Tax=Lentzea xerophila TaxID=3435883 RepID=UPI003DA2D9C9